MPRIYDFFMFNGEQEILEIRLNELYNVVDYFVIGSCEFSHSGIKKGVDYPREDLMDNFGDKIRFYEIPYIMSLDPWVNEQNGRDFLYEKVKQELNGDDILLINDLDEIPHSGSLLQESLNLSQPVTFCGDYYTLCFDLWGRHSPDGLIIKNDWKNRSLNWFRSHRTNFQYDYFKHVDNSSWHFSTIGTPENIIRKLKCFAHAPELKDKSILNVDFIKNCIRNRNYMGAELKKEEVNAQRYPKFLIDNVGKFNYLFSDFYEV